MDGLPYWSHGLQFGLGKAVVTTKLNKSCYLSTRSKPGVIVEVAKTESFMMPTREQNEFLYHMGRASKERFSQETKIMDA